MCYVALPYYFYAFKDEIFYENLSVTHIHQDQLGPIAGYLGIDFKYQGMNVYCLDKAYSFIFCLVIANRIINTIVPSH